MVEIRTRIRKKKKIMAVGEAWDRSEYSLACFTHCFVLFVGTLSVLVPYKQRFSEYNMLSLCGFAVGPTV